MEVYLSPPIFLSRTIGTRIGTEQHPQPPVEQEARRPERFDGLGHESPTTR